MKFSRLGDGSFFSGALAAYASAAVDGRQLGLAITCALLSCALFMWAQWPKEPQP